MESVQHLCNLQTLKTVGIMALHSFVTFPSLCLHSFQKKYIQYQKIEMSACSPLTNANVVIFVPGRNGARTDFLPLIANMQKFRCIEPNSVFLPNNAHWYLHTVELGDTGHTSLEEDAQMLQKHMDKHYTNCNICLVGLSKGGLVILRCALNAFDNNYTQNRITKLITLSSPLRGTRTASLFPSSSKVFQSLSYECKAVQDIAEHRTKLNVYHIVPTWDNIIIPSSAAKFIDTHESHVYHYKGYYGHTGIAYHFEIAYVLIKWLME